MSQATESCPQWDFPLCYQLCSKEHLDTFKYKKEAMEKHYHDNPELYFSNDKDKINKAFKVYLNPSITIKPHDLPLDSKVSYDIMTLFASGIGIYSTSNELLDDDYLKSVIIAAKKGLIKFIFADSSIAYGTNLSVSNIIVIDEQYNYKYNTINEKDTSLSIIDKHSIKTIFQMLGRAGRGGSLSYQAQIYTTSAQSNLIEKIHNYCRDNLNENDRDEVINIDNAFKKLW
ncbi:hypothetical protein EON71_01250 [bacterium]|nr:MAG: hypothetical protein EON71_01250 [bacterium]